MRMAASWRTAGLEEGGERDLGLAVEIRRGKDSQGRGVRRESQ